MHPIALVGHLHDCPEHGSGTIVSGAVDAKANGRAIARVGDTTSHGGTLEEGYSEWLVD